MAKNILNYIGKAARECVGPLQIYLTPLTRVPVPVNIASGIWKRDKRAIGETLRLFKQLNALRETSEDLIYFTQALRETQARIQGEAGGPCPPPSTKSEVPIFT